ncbi:MAG: tetratricopeptide repeat protein, partial [Acidobacteriota bacterium]
AEASQLFEDPMWKATALYFDQEFGAALEQFARVDSAEAWFGRGNCLAQMEQYEEAVVAYQRALDLRSDYPEAEANIKYLQPFLPLHFEGGDMGTVGRDAEADEVVFDADGDTLAEKGKDTEIEEGGLLSDEQLAEMWLRQVDTGTAGFLKYKFRYQAAQVGQEENP